MGKISCIVIICFKGENKMPSGTVEYSNNAFCLLDLNGSIVCCQRTLIKCPVNPKAGDVRGLTRVTFSGYIFFKAGELEYTVKS